MIRLDSVTRGVLTVTPMNKTDTQTIGFLGGGKMAEAIFAGLIGSGVSTPDAIRVCEINAERRAFLESSHGVQVFESASEALVGADVIFLAVKPQDLGASLDAARDAFTHGPLVISIAAGRTLDQIGAHLQNCRLVRVMPNLAAVVGESMSAFCGEQQLSESDRGCVRQLLSAFGRVIEVSEEQFHVVTAVSGSGPAFFAYLCDSLARGGVAEGLDSDQATQLALQTMLGTAKVLLEQGTSADELIQSVSSPKGTTVAGMDVLRGSEVREELTRTIHAAAERSRELSKG